MQNVGTTTFQSNLWKLTVQTPGKCGEMCPSVTTQQFAKAS